MRKILNYIASPFKWTGRKLWEGITEVAGFIWFFRVVIFWAIALIGGCFGISAISMHVTEWEVDPYHTHEGNFLVINVDKNDGTCVLAEDVEEGEYVVFNTQRLLRVNTDDAALQKMRLMIVPNRCYWFRYVQENEKSMPTIIQVEILNHIPPRKPKLINKGPKYNVFEKENKDEQENSEEVKQEQESGK